MAAGSNTGGRRGYQRELEEIIPMVEALVKDLQRRLLDNKDDEIEDRTRDYMLLSLYPAIKKVLEKGSASLAVTVAREYLVSRLRDELGRPNIILKARDELTPLIGVLTALRNEHKPRHDRVPRSQPGGRTIGGVPHVVPWNEGGPSGPANRQYRTSLKAPVSSQMR